MLENPMLLINNTICFLETIYKRILYALRIESHDIIRFPMPLTTAMLLSPQC